MVESTRDSVKCFHSWKHFNQSPTSSLFTITSYFTTWTRFAAAKPRRLQQSTGHRFRSLLPIESPAQRVSIGEEKSICKGAFCFQQNAEFAKRTSTKWWAKMDSLCCGKATAVATVHRTVAKSRLSSPFWFSRLYALQSFGFLFYSALQKIGGPKWTRTIDLTIISRVL